MRNLILTITIGMLSAFTFSQDDAQNLVPNGSFEGVEKKPKRLGKIELATGWVSPTGVRADLFVSSKMPAIDVPLNIYGKEVAKEGENYVGIRAYEPSSGKLKRSYVMTKLDSPLKKGMRYCVKFYVSLSESSKYAINNVGLMLTKKPFGSNEKISIIEEEVSLMHFNSDIEVISARYGWTEICGTFKSKGGEKHLTIGNFKGEDRESGELKRMNMKKDNKVKVAQSAVSYYFVDDVSVKLLAEGGVCDCLVDEGNDAYSTLIYQRVVTVTDDMSSKEKVNMQKVFFAFGKSKLTTQGQTTLDFIAEQLQGNPEAKLEMLGHNNTMEDSVGVTNAYYADMDNKRIGTVMKYLMSKGVPESQLIASMKGDTIKNEELLEDDDAELKMAKNRRVTFKYRD